MWHLGHRIAGLGKEHDRLCAAASARGLGIDRGRVGIGRSQAAADSAGDLLIGGTRPLLSCPCLHRQRLVAYGVTVLFDATASRQAYRDFARAMIPRFIEVAVECPLALCMKRDRKGTYQKGLRGQSTTVPGLQSSYESPANPELRIDTTKLSPQEAAKQICDIVRATLA